MKKMLSARIDKDVYDRAAKMAAAQDRSLSYFVNATLAKATQGKPSAKKPAKQLQKAESTATPEADEVTTLFDYLNDKAGSGFIPRGKDGKLTANGKLCAARLKEYGLNKLMLMIDHKCDEWEADDKMHKYLRPITLFNASKCGDYVGSIGKTARKKRSSLDEFLGRTGNDLEGDYKVL